MGPIETASPARARQSAANSCQSRRRDVAGAIVRGICPGHPSARLSSRLELRRDRPRRRVRLERLADSLGFSPRDKRPSPRIFTGIRLEKLRGWTPRLRVMAADQARALAISMTFEPTGASATIVARWLAQRRGP